MTRVTRTPRRSRRRACRGPQDHLDDGRNVIIEKEIADARRLVSEGKTMAEVCFAGSRR
jgi:hypothetical protein